MGQANLVKEKILNAAQKRMVQFGYHKVTMDEIALDLRMSKNTIYKCYDGKLAIAKALIRRLEKELDIRLNSIEKAKEDPLEIFSDSVLLLRQELSPWFEHFFRDIQLELPELWQEFLEFRNQKILRIHALVKKGSRNKIFRQVNPSIATEAFLGAVKAVTNPRYLQQEKLTFDQALNAVLDIWSNGIKVKK